MRLRPELQALPLQVHAAGYGPSKRARKKIRNLETRIVHMVGAAARQPFGVKNLVG